MGPTINLHGIEFRAVLPPAPRALCGQVQKQVTMDAFWAGAAAAHHPIQPSGKIGQNWHCHFSCTFLPRSGG
jgi:hypothetical protein